MLFIRLGGKHTRRVTRTTRDLSVCACVCEVFVRCVVNSISKKSNLVRECREAQPLWFQVLVAYWVLREQQKQRKERRKTMSFGNESLVRNRPQIKKRTSKKPSCIVHDEYSRVNGPPSKGNGCTEYLLMRAYVSDHLRAKALISLTRSVWVSWLVACFKALRRGSYEFMPFSLTLRQRQTFENEHF